MLITLLLAVLVFASAAAGDIVSIINTRAIASRRPSPHLIARTSVLEWAIGAVGWVIVLSHSFWHLIPEVAGLYVGSYIGAWYASRLA